MIALGWAFADDDVPCPFRAIARGPHVLVAADVPEGGDPRTVLRWLLECAARCRAFVPYAPGAVVAVEAALCRACPEDIAWRLERADAACQVTVSFSRPREDAGAAFEAVTGRAWLAARRRSYHRTTSEDARRSDAVAAAMRAAGADPVGVRKGRSADFDCIGPRRAVRGLMERLGRNLAEADVPSGDRVVVSGPWPLLAISPGGLA